MIRTIKSKALERFAETGDGSKLPVQNHDKVSRILQWLNAAKVLKT
jgi:proteic killer suppression protein